MKEKTNTGNRTVAEWLELSEKYFDALTTPREEEELKRFLATTGANAQCFDEIKAVMGYFSTKRAIKKVRSQHAAKIAGWSSAAATALALTFAWNGGNSEKDICIAYVDGIEYTNEALAMREMQRTFSIMASTTEGHLIEEQLNDIFNTINNF